MKISNKNILVLKKIHNKLIPNSNFNFHRIYDVLNSLDPKLKKSWIAYLKLFGPKISKLNEDSFKKKAYTSPLREFLMVIRNAAFSKTIVNNNIYVKKEKWTNQISDYFNQEYGDVYDCDYVVIGSGAGGASVAYKLASLGHAVIIIEEGDYYNRQSLQGDSLYSIKNLYKNRGFSMAWGKKIFPVFSGCAVGGTTAINSGTCIKYPSYIFDEWEDKYNISIFNSSYFDAKYLEASYMLNINEVEDKYIGEIGKKVKQAADKLGWENGPLPRNSIGCDGRATCCFGCPTGAKQSTDVSFIPKALNNGARLLINTKVDKIVIKNNKAIGVSIVFKDGKQSCIIPEKGVIVSCGALNTPNLLRESGIENVNVGRNLSLHPSISIFAIHKNKINMTSNCVPQSYHVPFLPNFVLEGVSMIPSIAAMIMPSVGDEFSYLMKNYDRLSMFGALIRDTSKGFVLKNGHVLYNINKKDLSTIKQALFRLIKLYSNMDDIEEVYPFINGLHKMKWYSDDSPWKDSYINKLWNINKISSKDVTISSYHPLGSCRMGNDPSTSVIGEDFKVWNTKNLYVVDGSIFPDSTGINPQLTIIAAGLACGENIGG
jgi:choline dehydrogenase-like flavoprotein